VLAALLTTPAALAYWGQRTLNDTGRYVDTVGPLVNSAEVQAAVATKVTNALEQQVDVETILNQAFAGVIDQRPRLETLVGPLASAINGLIETQVRNVLASDVFAEFWVTANTRLQQGLIRVLEGEDTGAVSLQDDQVVLDVSDVIDQVKQRLVDRGLTIVANVPTPAKDRQIVLFDAPRLEKARTTYALVNPVAQWLILVVAGLYLGALVLSRRRPRMTVIIGAVLVVNALLVAVALSVGRQAFINALSATDFATASTAVYDTLLAFLMRGQRVLLWLGLILIATGWFASRTGFGSSVRTSVRTGLEAVGGALGDGPAAGTGRWVAGNAGWLRIVIALMGGVVLLWGNEVSVPKLFWALVLVLALLVVVQVLVGAGKSSVKRSLGAGPGDRRPLVQDGQGPTAAPVTP